MIILPAIDIRDGKVVRLEQGDYDHQTTYFDNPATVARTFQAAGASWIHMVDLDAALGGRRSNSESVRQVSQAVDAKIQLGGGARNNEAVYAMLADGVSRVVVGSAALTDWPWFEKLLARADLAGKIALGLDARDGRLAMHGWTEQTELTPLEIARRVTDWPLGAIIYTDISRDGMLCGPNFQATEQLTAATDIPVIASGGISSIKDCFHPCFTIKLYC